MPQARIRVGIGGWDFEPWRGTFYPPGLPKARQLEHAGRQLTAIEINATHYRPQKPESFRKWAASVPEGFTFSVKASRYCTNRRILAEAGEGIERFCAQGLSELGEKLGPILWQFMPHKAYERDDFAAFLKLLPKEQDGMPLRHALEVRHESFRDPDFVALAREFGMAIVFADSDDYPAIADVTADFVYARLQRCRETVPTGYGERDLDRWASVAKAWREGDEPEELPYVDGRQAKKLTRDTFIFFIAGAKERAPIAAQALIGRL